MKRILILVALLLTMAGCHKGVIGTTIADSIPTDSLPTATESSMPHYLSSTLSCEVQGITANGLLRMQRDSVIWATASKFIELGRAKLTPDSIYVYAKIYNSYYAGTYDDIATIMGQTVDFAQLQRLLSGHILNQEPVSMDFRGQRIALRFGHYDQPTQLTFPFAIPHSAQRISLTDLL